MFKNQNMRLALDLASKASEIGEVPVGAVIIDKDQKIIASSHNEVEKRANPLAHAEMIAINQACQRIGSKALTGCDMFVSLEPCVMCAAAISFARVGRLYFGAYDMKFGGVESGLQVFNSTSCYYMPEVYGGILEEESRALLQTFFQHLRLNKN